MLFCHFPEQGPFKDTQAQINRSRVKRIDISSELEDFRGSASPGFSYHTVCELLKDPIVPVGIRLGEVAPGGGFSKPEVKGFGCVGPGYGDHIAETFAVGQLSKHHHGQLVPAGKVLDMAISVVFV